MIRVTTVALLLLAVSASCCSGGGQGDLPDPQRDHRADVRSDCRSWLAARATPEQIEAIARLIDAGVHDLTELATVVRSLGLPDPRNSLRWRRIAARRGEPPRPERAVVDEFFAAACELRGSP